MATISSAISSALLAAPAVPVCTLPDKPTACPLSVAAVRAEDGQGAYVGLIVVSGGTAWLVAVEGMTCAADASIAVDGLVDGGDLGDGLVGWPDVVSTKTEGRTLGRAVNARIFDLVTREDIVPAELLRGACRRAYEVATAGGHDGGDDTSALDAARAATAAAERRAADAITRADQTKALLDTSRLEVESLRAEVAALRAAAPAPEVKAEAYDEVLDLINNGLMPYLYGPAGTGKSYVCEQIAREMGWEYHQTGAILDLAEGLRGYRDIKGDIQSTEFLRALDAADDGHDVLFVFDEIDGSAPELLITLNNYLAGGCIECCGRVYNRRPNLRICACGNTSGQGATAEYVARCKLDDASLDRFELVEVGYSREVELASAGGDAELVDFCEGLRAAAESCGVSWLVSNRRIRALAVRGCSAAAVRGSLLRGRSLDAARSVYDALPNNLKACQWGATLEYVINGGR